MRILFVRDFFYVPDMVGGIERNTQALIRHLKVRNIPSVVVARTYRKGIVGFYNRIIQKLLPSKFSVADYFAGHATYRYWNPLQSVASAIATFRPDVLVVQGGAEGAMVEVCLSFGLPVVWYVHGMDFRPPSPSVAKHELLTVMACGQFVADCVLAETQHRPEVIRPLIEPADYRVRSSRREVLFVNPRVEKGLDMAWALAEARPDIPFRFVEAWHLSPEMRRDMRQRARQLGNVTIERSRKDMRPLYARAKLLITPSHSEGHCRAVSEAQLNGIPVLSSDRDGLPEAVGNGGVLLPLELGAAPWIAELSRLWDDDAYYRNLSDAALAHAERPDFTPDYITDQFLAHLKARTCVLP